MALTTVDMFHLFVLSFCLLSMTCTVGAVDEPCNVTHTSDNLYHVWCDGPRLTNEYMEYRFPLIIPENVAKIRISNGNFTELPQNMIGNCSAGSKVKARKLLKQLDLSHNVITTIHGRTFHCMPNLETLILKDNLWKLPKNITHTGYFNNLKNLKLLDLTDTFRDKADGSIHVIHLGAIFADTDYSKLEVLRMGSNELRFVGNDFMSTLCYQMPNLRRLTLDNNSLYKIEVPSCYQKLEFMDLSYNAFGSLDQSTVNAFDEIQKSTSNFTVKLLHQEWSCDCNIVAFHNWLRHTKVQVYKKQYLRCYDGKNFNKSIYHLQTTDLNCYLNPPDKAIKSGVVVLIVLLSLIAIAVIAAVVMYRSRIRKLADRVYQPIRKNFASDTSNIQYSSVEDTPIA